MAQLEPYLVGTKETKIHTAFFIPEVILVAISCGKFCSLFYVNIL